MEAIHNGRTLQLLDHTFDDWSCTVVGRQCKVEREVDKLSVERTGLEQVEEDNSYYRCQDRSW